MSVIQQLHHISVEPSHAAGSLDCFRSNKNSSRSELLDAAGPGHV
jgi:hypothetical protein